jgi:hypothetical protein
MMQTITNIGLDIAKVFQVHCVDADGNVVLRCQLKRRYVPAFFQKWAELQGPALRLPGRQTADDDGRKRPLCLDHGIGVGEPSDVA